MRKLYTDAGIALDYTDAIGVVSRTEGKNRYIDILFPSYVYTLGLSGKNGVDLLGGIYLEIKTYVQKKVCSENEATSRLVSELESLKVINRNQCELIQSLNLELDKTEDALLESGTNPDSQTH